MEFRSWKSWKTVEINTVFVLLHSPQTFPPKGFSSVIAGRYYYLSIELSGGASDS